MLRHPKEGHYNSHRVNPHLTISAPLIQWRPTLSASFGFDASEGEYNCSVLEEYFISMKDTKVETANEGRLSSCMRYYK